MYTDPPPPENSDICRWCAHTRGLVPATSPLKSLHEGLVAGTFPTGTVHTEHFAEPVAGACPRKHQFTLGFTLVWIRGTSCKDHSRLFTTLYFRYFHSIAERTEGIVRELCLALASLASFAQVYRQAVKSLGLKLVHATRFWSKNGQFTRWDLYPWLAAGTSPLGCADLTVASVVTSRGSTSTGAYLRLYVTRLLWHTGHQIIIVWSIFHGATVFINNAK